MGYNYCFIDFCQHCENIASYPNSGNRISQRRILSVNGIFTTNQLVTHNYAAGNESIHLIMTFTENYSRSLN